MNQRHSDQEELAALRRDVAYLVERQRRTEELFEEMIPVMKLLMDDVGERLEGLDKKGYTAFGRELLRVMDRVVEGFSADDVRQLGDNVVSILDTVKSVTQPDVMQVLHEATNAIHDGDAEEQGLFGMLKATRDKDVRKGLGVVLGVLKHVGRAADQVVAAGTSDATRALASRRPGLARALAPRRGPALPAPRPERAPAARAAAATEHAAPAPEPQDVAEIAGRPLDPEGFLADPDSWDRAFATAMAAHVGVELTDAHWPIIDYARGAWKESGKAANVRALAKGAEMSTRDLYQLFPKAPGKTIAKIAGTPKPAGCL